MCPSGDAPRVPDVAAWTDAPRFFLSPRELWEEERTPELREFVLLVGDEAHHAARVLRLVSGDPVVLLDGSGYEVCGVVERVESERRESEVVVGRLERRRSAAEPAMAVHLVQGLPKGDKLELVLQKGTEVGVTHFWPVYTERVIVSYTPQKIAARHGRWERIVLEAAKQSRRARVPVVAQPLQLTDVVRSLHARGCVVIVLWERAIDPLRTVLRRYQGPDSLCGPGKDPEAGIALVVGPEGGLTAEEVERLERLGAQTASLGPRILRTETAGMLAGALALYELESGEAQKVSVPRPQEEA